MLLTGSVAEWLERHAEKRGVAGSIPDGGIYLISYMRRILFRHIKSAVACAFCLLLVAHQAHTNTLKIRILSETSILYLIRYASVILIVGLRL